MDQFQRFFANFLVVAPRENILGDVAANWRTLVKYRNGLLHYREIADAENLLPKTMRAMEFEGDPLLGDAMFEISTAVRLLSLPSFRVG